MPNWVIALLIQLAIKFGIPWIVKMLPNISPDILKIIEELLNGIKGVAEDKKELKRSAIKKVGKCYGVACEPSLKEASNAKGHKHSKNKAQA